ncbi:hypothetical protein PAHAL_3G152700 [Panicum hallii]|uniref:Uncharacterized protein n=1 Tax=Panicum hallii TaxID=206008 RepID=A0A2T8KIC7_9POAL|nr:hypothetical protein PAHAL_3G152700 [Panicum hallii]
MHAQRSLGCRPCRLGPTEGLAHPHSGPHQWRAATLPPVAMVGTASGRARWLGRRVRPPSGPHPTATHLFPPLPPAR